MIDQLNLLFAVKDYIPHGYCLSWSPNLVMIYAISDLLIFIAYFSMPLALAYFARRRADFPYQWLLWLFAAFIMACGTTHLMGAIVLWTPLYGLDALLRAATALLSVITAAVLWPLLPHALKLPSPAQLRLINQELQSEIAERNRIEEELRIAKAAAEEGLLRQRMLMAAIVESSQDAIIGKTLDNIGTSWNRAAERIFGYSADEMIGRSLLCLIAPEQHDDEQKRLGRIRRGESINQLETQLIRKNGNRIDVSVTLSPILDLAGQVVGASQIVRDITEQKRVAAQIRELNANLEQKVNLRTLELSAANRELDSFAYAVSHDLRAPLRAMSGFSRALIEDYGDSLQGESRVYLQQIDLASRKMGELIDGLLTLSRGTRGELRHDALDISLMSQHLLAELAKNEPERQVSIEVESGLQAYGDARMLEVVMANLLSNAWKYTAGTDPAMIRVHAEQRDGVRHFCVADNGAGFDMAHANRLFQPFQRLHRQDEFPGIGIGLATVQRIINRHGGGISARGEAGKGAVFCFTLPEQRPESARDQ